MIDYTKILKKIVPEKDGETPAHLRTGVVSAVNANGTVDILMSGVTVPGVPRLAEATVQVGATVQILASRGSLLVIGQAMSSGRSAGAGLWTRVQSNTSQTGVGTSLTGVLTTPSTTFLKNRVYEVKSHAGAQGGAGTWVFFAVVRTGSVTIGEGYRFPLTTTAVFNTGLSGIYFAVNSSANVTGTIQLQMSASTGTATHYANSTQERNLEVWDVGDVSQFSGVPVW
ncbi:MAG TPA: hypothetical protein VFU47_02665 [Armatimonadota bacterium]|nr:hypothetical protein [Armatimonadota bacterium]